MATAAIMRKSSVFRALLIFAVMSSPSVAAIYSAALNSAASNIYAFKPLDVVFPGFVRSDLSDRPSGYRGFSGFVDEVRNAVKLGGGAPDIPQEATRSLVKIDPEISTRDPTYEESIPIRTGQAAQGEETTEVYLGFSVKQILNEIPAEGANSREHSTRSAGLYGSSSIHLASPVGHRGSLGAVSTIHSGGFLSTQNVFTTSGFGLDLRPLAYPNDPNDLGNGPYISRESDDPDVEKKLKSLRQMVLNLVFNPVVYFTLMVIFVIMIMARFRRRSS